MFSAQPDNILRQVGLKSDPPASTTSQCSEVTVCKLEVIEHCFSPKAYLETMFKLIEPGGLGIISTPFHGYWKNLALSLANKWDSHLGPLWEGGHIKFFSEKTLAQALQSAGFTDMDFRRAGRFSLMAKSTVVAFRRPSK